MSNWNLCFPYSYVYELLHSKGGLNMGVAFLWKKTHYDDVLI
jgi:hypothetical protein